ncbi:MAG TPA: amidase [Thermomicrobiales bacterium]|nr:amidase [Thermomicrobiales bacterium]
MNSIDVCYLPAVELRDHYLSRALSPVEVTETVLARMDRLEPTLNAFITPTPDLAMQNAREAELAYARGDAGPLAGIPTSIKDLTLTRGIRSTRGSLLMKDYVPDFDPPVVERLYSAGIVMLGKTNTPESGWKGETTNRVSGSTHNPWNHGRTPGGSSGGASAAIAAGMGPLAQGSDGAGSIRIPSSFAGIFGLKPSFGLVPQYPASAMELFSHVGPMTRTVADAALMLTVMAGEDVRDRLSWSSGIDYLAALKPDVSGLRVAWSPDLGYARLDPDVRAVTEAAVGLLRDLGCEVVDATPEMGDPWDLVDIIWSGSQAGVYGDQPAEVRDLLDPGLARLVESGMRLSGAEFVAAHTRRASYYQSMRRFMEEFDLLLTPTLPITAFEVGKDHPGEICGKPTTYLGWTAFAYPFNITGLPAASVPCGFDRNGLPIGLQIVGRWRDDQSVLNAAAAFEQAAPWAGDRPPLD